MKGLSILPILALLLCFGCSKEETEAPEQRGAITLDAPQNVGGNGGGGNGVLESCLRVPEQIISNASLEYTSCATGASTYLWEFGDGVSSTEQNPTHVYQNPGDYTISLTVGNADGSKTERAEQQIRVFTQIVTSVRIITLPDTKPEGSTWDMQLPIPIPIPGLGPEPDLVVSFGMQGSSETINTEVSNDLGREDLPVTIPFPQQIQLTGLPSSINLLDQDVGLSGTTFENMGGWSQALAGMGENGAISLKSQDGRTEIALLYTLQ